MPASAVFRITPVLDRLLRGDPQIPMGLYHLHIATAEQLTRLHYSPNSIKRVQARLKLLTDNGYIQSDSVPTRNYRSPLYYALAQKGARYLSGAGLDMPPAFRASKEVGKSYLYLAHTLEVNDLLIAAMLLQKDYPALSLDSFLHERTLKHQPYKFTWQNHPITLIPDAYIVFGLNREERRAHFPLLLEHDRATEEKQHFRQRIRAYIALLKGEHHRELLGVGAITIAFTTFTGSSRLEQMRAWTRQELDDTKEDTSIGARFRFAALPYPVTPVQAWLAPVWYPPYADSQARGLLTV